MSAISSGTTPGSPAPDGPGAGEQPAPRHEQEQRADRGGGAERAQQRADDDVALGGVPQLVGDDQLDLRRRRLLEQRVVDDDAPGAGEAADVGVERRRPARGVRDQHLVDRHAVTLGQASRSSRSSPAGSGVKRLKTGSTTTG
jgi:hypothetical protein